MNLKIEWLKYFITLCEFNSFTESARKLNITVSSLSQNITALENFLSVTLIIRKPKYNEITKEGYIFLREARETLNQFESLETFFKDFPEKNKKSILKIGWTNIWGSILLPDLIKVLFKEYPSIYPQIYAFSLSESIKFIELNEIDFAVLTIKNSDNNFLNENKQIGYQTGKKYYFADVNKDNNLKTKNIYLNGSFDLNKDFSIKTASINSLIYLCSKEVFSTTLPEILADKNDFQKISRIETNYIQPVLIWNKNIPQNKLRNKVIETFIGLNK